MLVCAPTGAGKTVVGEFAVTWRWPQGRKCFYTTPIKALSNQKYADLVARLRRRTAVGLLTGDNAINGDAPVVVMTTEVLRNMLYAGSAGAARARLRGHGRGALPRRPVPRRGLGRGHHPPARVGAAGLAVGDGQQRRGVRRLAGHRARRTPRVVVERAPAGAAVAAHAGRQPDVRPVRRAPARRRGEPAARVHPRAGAPVADAETAAATRVRTAGATGADAVRPARGDPVGPPLAGPTSSSGSTRAGLLPAITFIFSRAGCDAAVAQCLHAGLRLTSDRGARRDPRRSSTSAPPSCPTRTCTSSATGSGARRCERGLAAHHAGLLPGLQGDRRGAVRPRPGARPCSPPRPSRWASTCRPARSSSSGWSSATARPTSTSRRGSTPSSPAGPAGAASTSRATPSSLWAPGMDPRAVAGLASTRTYPLRSSFRPSYNMARQPGRALGRARPRGAARIVLRPVPGRPGGGRAGPAGRAATSEALARLRRVDDLPTAATSPSTPQLRHELADRETHRARRGAAAPAGGGRGVAGRRCKRGDVIRVPSGRRAGLAVVLDPGVHGRTGDADSRPLVLTEDRLGRPARRRSTSRRR